MLAFVDEHIARGAAHALGHPIDCVLLRERGGEPGMPRRKYRFSPSGDTTWIPIRDRRTCWRAGKACARLRGSAYYRWWVSPPPIQAEREGAEAPREAECVVKGAASVLSHNGNESKCLGGRSGDCAAMKQRGNFEFVTGGSALVGGGSSIQRSASAAVIWAEGNGQSSFRRMQGCGAGGEKQDAPGDLQIPRGVAMGTPTNQASDFLRG
jgi:hypothetical protein